MTKYVDALGLAFMAYAALELIGVLLVLLFALLMGGVGGFGLSTGDYEAAVIGGSTAVSSCSPPCSSWRSRSRSC